MKEYLVLDIGGSAIKYGTINENRMISNYGETAAPKKNLDEFVECIAGIYNSHKDSIEGIALSLAGTIEPRTGFVTLSGAFPFLQKKNLIEILQEKCSVKITVANDANCAAIAEMKYGCLRGIKDGILVVLGSSIGGTIIRDGKIYHGKHFSAGEFSLIKTDGSDDGLGNLWRNRNGKNGLLRLVQSYANTEKQYTGKEIFQLAEAGNESVLRAIDEFCRQLAIQLYNLQVIFDGECIAIGGGISSQPILYTMLNKQLDRIYAQEKDYGLASYRPNIAICEYHNDANLIGAYCVHISK